MQRAKKHIFLVLGILVGVVFILGAARFTRAAFRQEKRSRSNQTQYGVDTDSAGLNIFVTLEDVDPLRQMATALVAFYPNGRLNDGNGNPSWDINVFCNNLTPPEDHPFTANETMSPYEMTVNLQDGLAADYPFDRYLAELEFQTTRLVRGHRSGPRTLIPTRVFVTPNVSGFKLTPGAVDEGTAGYVDVKFQVQRFRTTVSTAVAGMVVMWAIGLSVLSLTLNIVLTREHLNTLTFLSGLLFALFSFRNSMPGTPPVGTFSDFAAFFWVEAIVSISLVVVVFLNILRHARPGEPSGPETDTVA